MDPATFKIVLDTQKQNLADVKERRKLNKSNAIHKNEWKNFFSTKRKKRRGKARFVWESKKIKQQQVEMEFIKSIHNLKIPMGADPYEISDTKTAMVTEGHDSYVDSSPDSTTPMDVDSLEIDCDSDPDLEGDDTMTIASLVDGANINIDSPKFLLSEQQTQTESPTQLFPESDDSDDDEGESLFED